MFVLQKNFIKRNVLGFLMISGFYWINKQHIGYLSALINVITFGCMLEILSLAKHKKHGFGMPITLVYGMTILLYLLMIHRSFCSVYACFKNINHYSSYAFYSYLLCFCKYVSKFKKRKIKKQLLTLTMMHVGAIVSAIANRCAIKNLLKGKFYVIFPAALVIANDMGAYFVGKSFGKTKLYKFSPNKTVEGFIGGFVFTCLVAWVTVFLKITPLNQFVFFAVCVASFFAPFAGFMASVIKRFFKKKDYGALIPGHGGLMDRFDCHFFAVIIVFYYLH